MNLTNCGDRFVNLAIGVRVTVVALFEETNVRVLWESQRHDEIEEGKSEAAVLVVATVTVIVRSRIFKL